LSLAASKKLEKEREKEAKRLRKKEEKDRRRRSKSEKKTRKKKEKGKVSFPTAEQPPFILQPASFQSDGTPRHTSSSSSISSLQRVSLASLG
jgi:hypothetical protein